MTENEDEPVAKITIGRLPIHALGTLQRNLQHFYDMSALALGLLNIKDDVEMVLPETQFGLRLTINEEKPVADVRQELAVWIIRSGLRESIEMVSGFLEDIRQQCSLVPILKQGRTTCGDFEKAYETESKQFHELGFPKKIRGHSKSIFERFTICSSKELEDAVISINTARNCLVHGGGRVRQKDLSEDNQLIVTWFTSELFVSGVSGRRKLEMPNAHFEADEMLGFEIKPGGEKRFSKGEPVVFTVHEFNEICITLYMFSREITLATEKYFQIHDLLKNESSCASDPQYSPQAIFDVEFD